MMPPVNYIAEKTTQLSCNNNEVLTFWSGNITTIHGDDVDDSYDSAGAMKFIITTLLVYSLLGITGMLLVRIRRRASRAHRVVTLREEDLQQYIKRADDLKMAGHRYKLRMDTTRMVRYLHNLERQRSLASNETSPNDESTSLLSPVDTSEQILETVNPSKVHPSSPSYSLTKTVELPPLPEYYNDLTWLNAKSRTSLCKTCIALSDSLSKEANTKDSSSVEKENSDWSDDVGSTSNESPEEEQPQNEWLSKHVLVSHV